MASVKKFFIAIMAVVAGTHAAVLTHQETFNDVKVISPAKSTQTTCKTRVDLSEGLVDNTQGCDIEEILVYNKNHMWIGSLGGVEGGYHKRYADYDVDRYKGKGIQIGIVYSFTPQDADPSNRWMVSCPKGMIAYIWDEYYSCKKPFTCSNGMYAIDSLECEELPEGAHRNATTGYSCNKGYVMRNGYCEEKATCGVNEAYDKTENTCLERPDNSHWIKNTLEWECNNGYVLQGDACEKILKCDSASRYYAEYNTCVELPVFAHWNDSVSTDWTCDPGYVLYGAGCAEKAICSSEQRYDESANSCVDPYPNSRWVGDNGNYVCNDGYVDVGYGRCEVKAVCSDYHYDADNNSCYAKPEHSHWLSRYGSEWACDVGFVQIDEHCEVKAECDHYNSANNSCFEKPDHAHWAEATGEAWICDDGWWSNGNFCEEHVSCGWFERYNADNNTCVSKPSHSHWTTEWNYACDDGYYETYGECVETNPIHLSDYTKFFHSLTFIIGCGDVKDKHDVSTTLFNTALEYNIGIRVGTDFFNVRPQAVIGLLSSGFDYSSTHSYGYGYLDEIVYSTALVVGLGMGVDIWHFTIDYNYLYAERETLANVDFYSTLHQFKVGYNFNEHWNINIASISQLIKTTNVLKEYDNTIYNIGVSYAF